MGERLGQDAAFAAWILEAAAGRSSFDVPLLVLAGLHFQVLCRRPEARELAAYYPSVGGPAPATAPGLGPTLFATLDALRDELAAFIATRPVQTNEGARGLCWLLPATYTGWKSAHLVELGASAGLNLAADGRRYELSLQGGGLQVFGLGREDAFAVQGEGDFVPPATGVPPQILSRSGCDLAPLALADSAERAYLAAFVWADQPARLQALKAGISALLQASSNPPLSLEACRLPEELPAYLAGLGRLAAPCILFNSYITMYLPDRGRGLAPLVARWARAQPHPVLWLQWEHLRGDHAPKAPVPGWLAWQADLWQNGRHGHWHLAWVHPHGSRVCWLPALTPWRDFWS